MSATALLGSMLRAMRPLGDQVMAVSMGPHQLKGIQGEMVLYHATLNTSGEPVYAGLADLMWPGLMGPGDNSFTVQVSVGRSAV
jgi:hypothetical protein